MASSLEYVQYVAAQLSGAGVISYKKLFGEYGLWCGGKFFGTVENNQFYGRPGMYLVEELDDREFLTALVLDTCSQLPDPSLPKRK